VRVLVVEDELRLAENIATALRDGPGYAVDGRRQPEAAARALLIVIAADPEFVMRSLAKSA
jgi:DNA-binding response OmpR family regulator